MKYDRQRKRMHMYYISKVFKECVEWKAKSCHIYIETLSSRKEEERSTVFIPSLEWRVWIQPDHTLTWMNNIVLLSVERTFRRRYTFKRDDKTTSFCLSKYKHTHPTTSLSVSFFFYYTQKNFCLFQGPHRSAHLQ